MFTDIDGSTRLLEHLGEDAFAELIQTHHSILRRAVSEHGGHEVSTEGDSFFVVFVDARAAVAAAVQAQAALESADWPAGARVRVRMGLHTGAARLGGDNYIGLTVTQAARIAACAHGGQSLASAATVQAAGTIDGSSWQPLGRHRLKGLGAAIELYQLRAPGMPERFPPLRSDERIGHSVPVQPSSFLGRRRELEEGASLLSGSRLLTITGPGGTGKTRMALQLAMDQLDSYPDGAWVAELASVTSGALVPAAVAKALRLSEEQGRTLTETSVDHLRHRHALLVLDNCEHLVDAVAAFVDEVLRSCPQVRVLATSREPLRASGERVWLLEPLALPEERTTPETIGESEAVQLFCERAAEAQTGFTLDDTNAAHIAAICARLDGLPLAIELAASRVRSMTPATIASRLETKLDLLSKGRRGAEGRQASMREAIGWSYEALNEQERLGFERLGAFIGGFTLEAAEHVCEQGEATLDVLDALVDKSLVVVDRHPDENRYRLLETVRAFAVEQLAQSGSEQQVRGRHASFYGKTLRATLEEETFAGIERDEANVVEALGYLQRWGTPAEHGHMVIDVAEYFRARGRERLAAWYLATYEERDDRDRSLEGRVLIASAWTSVGQARYDHAQETAERALALARTSGDRAAERAATWVLARGASQTGDYEQADVLFQQVRRSAREDGDVKGEVLVLPHMAGNAGRMGDLSRQVGYAEEARRSAPDLGLRRISLWALKMIGDARDSQFRFDEARDMFRQALAIGREIGLTRETTAVLLSIGMTAVRTGDLDEASAALSEAHSLAIEDISMLDFCFGGFGEVALASGDLEGAAASFEEARSIAALKGERGPGAYWTGMLGHVALRRGDDESAIELFDEALAGAAAGGVPWAINLVHVGASQAALRLGRLDEAIDHVQRALLLAGEPAAAWSLLLQFAEVLATLTMFEESAEILAVVETLGVSFDVMRRITPIEGGPSVDDHRRLVQLCRRSLGESGFRAAWSRGVALRGSEDRRAVRARAEDLADRVRINLEDRTGADPRGLV